MESNDYAVFIISHGRPECRTYNKYLGGENCYIVCDDEDEALQELLPESGAGLHAHR